DGAVREVSYAELRRMSDALARRLEELGIAAGDTVGVFMPMAPEAVAAMFACAKLGAIFIPIFSGYAADAVATRLQDANAKVLVTADGFQRRGARVPMKSIADEAADASPTVEHVVVWRRYGARGHGLPLRGRAELPGARPHLGHGRTPPNHDTRRLPHPDPRADPRGRRTRHEARPQLIADHRLDGRAVEPRALPVDAEE